MAVPTSAMKNYSIHKNIYKQTALRRYIINEECTRFRRIRNTRNLWVDHTLILGTRLTLDPAIFVAKQTKHNFWYQVCEQ